MMFSMFWVPSKFTIILPFKEILVIFSFLRVILTLFRPSFHSCAETFVVQFLTGEKVNFCQLTDSEVNKRFRHAPTLGYNKRVEWLADQIILNFSILCVMIRTGIVFFIISRQRFLATLVLKKEQEGQEEDREKETLKKIKVCFFCHIWQCQALGHVITCFPYFSYW